MHIYEALFNSLKINLTKNIKITCLIIKHQLFELQSFGLQNIQIYVMESNCMLKKKKKKNVCFNANFCTNNTFSFKLNLN